MLMHEVFSVTAHNQIHSVCWCVSVNILQTGFIQIILSLMHRHANKRITK